MYLANSQVAFRLSNPYLPEYPANGYVCRLILAGQPSGVCHRGVVVFIEGFGLGSPAIFRPERTSSRHRQRRF